MITGKSEEEFVSRESEVDWRRKLLRHKKLVYEYKTKGHTSSTSHA
jgi:hypothetical protein